MLAVLALFTVTLLSFNQQQSTIHMQQELMRNELASVAAGKLTEELDRAALLSFGQLDDLERDSPREVTVSAGALQMTLEVAYSVCNVRVDSSGEIETDGSGKPRCAPNDTKHKQLSVRARGPLGQDAPRVQLPENAEGQGQIVLSRLYASSAE